MKRPRKDFFKIKYVKGGGELSNIIKQYSKAQDEYIDYLEQITIPAVMRSCFYEAWKKWRNEEDEEKFEQWLYDKATTTQKNITPCPAG